MRDVDVEEFLALYEGRHLENVVNVSGVLYAINRCIQVDEDVYEVVRCVL